MDDAGLRPSCVICIGAQGISCTGPLEANGRSWHDHIDLDDPISTRAGQPWQVPVGIQRLGWRPSRGTAKEFRPSWLQTDQTVNGDHAPFQHLSASFSIFQPLPVLFGTWGRPLRHCLTTCDRILAMNPAILCFWPFMMGKQYTTPQKR